MTHSMEKNVRQTRFAIADLQKRITVLEATREDLERQIRKPVSYTHLTLPTTPYV